MTTAIQTGTRQRTISERSTVASPKRLARIAGLLYLAVGILGGFAFAGVYSAMYVAGDAAATAGNLFANAGLVKIGVAADLIQVVVWVFLALTLYVLLQHVSGYAARAMVVLVAIGASISFLNILFEFQGMRIATDPTYTATVGAAGATALAMVMLDLQHYGYAIAGIFFGLWLVPLGYLAFKSGMFPRVLGVVLVVGGIGYLFDTLADIRGPRADPDHSPDRSTAWHRRRGVTPRLPPREGSAQSPRRGPAVRDGRDSGASGCVGQRTAGPNFLRRGGIRRRDGTFLQPNHGAHPLRRPKERPP